jgi:cation transport regulator ChaC
MPLPILSGPMAGRWVFGYGSLVSPVSFGHTLGRDLAPGVDFFEAELSGYGRRWNYGTDVTFTAIGPDGAERTDWTFIALGLVPAMEESANGVIGWVDDTELVALDRRESRYGRVDVTEVVTVAAEASSVVGDARIVTYVPRPEPIAAFEAARARGVAAITTRYWDLVDEAFADLGADRRDRYHATTPDPGIPLLVLAEADVPERHRGRRP